MRWQTTERYLRNLIAQKLEIPMLGKVFFAVPAGSATSLFEEWARTEMDIPAELLFTGALAPAQAFEEASGNRNDVILVFPGAYALTSELAWNKNNVHAVGMGGPRCWNDYSEPGCSIYTTTTEVAETVDVTGNFCQFHGLNFGNNGAHAGNLAAFNLDGYGAHIKGCSFHGIMNATQRVVEAAGALYIDGLGSGFLIEDCVIGDNQWTVRTQANQGQLCFVADSASYRSANGTFRKCQVRSSSETAAVVAVRILKNSCDRVTIWEDCSFTNFSANWANTLAGVFYYTMSPQTNIQMLRGCSMTGFDEWQTQDYQTMIMSDMGVATVGGGICIEPTGTIA